MRLYLIRHGQSTNNALATEGRYQTDRTYDPQLTEIGKQQAQRVADYLSQASDMPGGEPLHFTHIYCSPMIRALQTAQPIAQAMNMHPEIWIDIHEIGGLFMVDNGDGITSHPGLSRSEIAQIFPTFQIPAEIDENGWWYKGKETPADFVSRAIRTAFAVRERAHTEERIALVAHAAFFDAFIKALLNQSPMHPDTLFYNHYNTGFTRIDFGSDTFYNGAVMMPERMRIHYINRVDHLPFDLRTW